MQKHLNSENTVKDGSALSFSNSVGVQNTQPDTPSANLSAEGKFNLLLDYDSYGWPDLLYASDLLDIVKLDAKRFLEYPEMGGTIVIKRSMNGYHLRAPFASLTKAQQEYATNISHADSGYKYWASHHGKSTLRLGDKTIIKQIGERYVGKRVEHDTPQVVEVLKNDLLHRHTDK